MKKALIAMSGGVDSSVAAYLMQRAGYTCQGVTMRLYRNSDLGMACHKTCCAETDAEDAALVCFRLGIAFEELDYSALFRYRVIERFAAAYEAGLTPNPCVDCNRFMKFDTLLEHALSVGCDKLATGHYARIGYCAESRRWELRKAVDASKDQSYVLYMLTQRQLAHLALPLGGYHKDEIRKIACEQGFVTATKRESQDICFVPDGDYAAFLERWRGKPFPDGALLDNAGREIGRHRGAVRFTVGQRRGLGFAAGVRQYVVEKDMRRNTVTLGPESALYHSALLAEEMNWLSIAEPAGPIRATARTRYHQSEHTVTVWPLPGGRARILFDEPQRAITPGQAVVLYDGELVLGGGTITQVEA
ncbi:MAG TPA: tRNA 2-thiouridine(34) synthase MnmA [Clostridiales bacterium]|nr:tRNA 2-thiouridine(34) synthase MnmA [Clostridiales bacterium]